MTKQNNDLEELEQFFPEFKKLSKLSIKQLEQRIKIKDENIDKAKQKFIKDTEKILPKMSNGELKDSVKKFIDTFKKEEIMSKITVRGTYTVENPEKSIISIEPDGWEDNKGKKIEAAEIRMWTEGDELELEIRLPIEGIKRIFVACKKFLETGKTSTFYYDKFHVGNAGETREIEIPSKEALTKFV